MLYHANKAVLCPSAVYFRKRRENSIPNDNYDTARKKSYTEEYKKNRRIFREFMRVNEIKRPNKLLYYIKKRFA